MQFSELYNINNNYDQVNDNEINDFMHEIPIGWSSACLDQTIHYYIECNINTVQNKEEIQ